MKKLSLLCVVLFTLSIMSCAGGSGDNAAEDQPPTEPKTSLEKLIGEWTVRINAPYTSCARLDLGEYAGNGWEPRLTFATENIGSFSYVYISSDEDAPEDAPLKYSITDSGDPFKMERVFNDPADECNWSYSRKYELTYLSDDRIFGEQRTDITSSTGRCEACYFTLRVEMKRGNYSDIDNVPPS